ncbi:MAG TPA: orotate phosphoribosyltransferase [Geminicoccaceae bacterium]|nr:orotate phosphoribosyltransferase [Geminicoccaceae bacterium]
MSSAASLPQDVIVQLFRDSGALLEGHFLLSSGLHSAYYLQCARVLMEPKRAERVCAALRASIQHELPALGFDAIVAPALGGVVLGYELARQFETTALFVERVEGRFALRRGFTLAPGARVLIAEDVVTTGLSTRECMACVRAEGAEIVAAACLIDRSGGAARLDVPLVALARLELPVYPADRLPPELAAQPAVKPGSRAIPPAP